jgi:hypothetical protein
MSWSITIQRIIKGCGYVKTVRILKQFSLNAYRYVTDVSRNVTKIKGSNALSKTPLHERVNKMRNHTNHKVLGNYCWDCKKKTAAGVPGWPKSRKNDGTVKVQAPPSMVIWANGEEDTSRTCFHCLNTSCKNPVLSSAISPVGDGYGEIEGSGDGE